MKYLIAILALLVVSNAFAAGRINPFNGQPITYSLSESVERDAMGAGAYDRMRMQMWQNRHAMRNTLQHSRGYHQNGVSKMDVAEWVDERVIGTILGKYRWPIAWLNGVPQNMHIMQQDNSESTFNGGEGDEVKQGVTKASNAVGKWVSSW